MLQSWVKLQERSSNALKRKFVFIGIDGGMYSSIKKYAEEGLIPNIASLIEEGAFFNERCNVGDQPLFSILFYRAIHASIYTYEYKLSFQCITAPFLQLNPRLKHYKLLLD